MVGGLLAHPIHQPNLHFTWIIPNRKAARAPASSTLPSTPCKAAWLLPPVPPAPTLPAGLKPCKATRQLSGISSELQNLHDTLRSGASDTSALASSLSTLGEHTTKVAASATPDAQDKLRQLGQALSTAAGQLKG